VVVVVVDLAVIGAWTGFGASVVVVDVVEVVVVTSFFLQPAAKTAVSASTKAKEISFFITSPHFLNLPYKRYAYGIKSSLILLLNSLLSSIKILFFRGQMETETITQLSIS
jgi:hypothetical protein